MIGLTISHYRVTAKLGAGGMGEVYRATDSRLGREVALKVLSPSFAADRERMARFEREAQLLASLNHPGIASIFGLEESNGCRALVMELIEGPTLADRIREGPMPLAEALEIAKQIAGAVEYAHDRGIIHRDLKPANVKLAPDGAVKLLDFGLAKALEGDAASEDASKSPTISRAATLGGIILGTAAYMSPEQAKGKPVDRRADIWAFGAVLYEMLTGKPLYAGETTSEILARVIEREPDLNALPPNTPDQIRRITRRCLTKNPRQRLRDIGDARVELEEYLAHPAGAPATDVLPRGSHVPGWQQPFLWALGGLILGAIATATAIWWLKPPAPAAKMMRFSAVTNFAGLEAEPTLSPDGRSVAFLSDRSGQLDIWVGLVTGGSPVRITNDPNLKARPRWSPDGTRIAYARLNESGLWDIWIVPALGGASRKVLAQASDPAWSPDSRSLAYANNADGAIWMCDATGSNARRLTQPESRIYHRHPAFSGDARRLAFARRTDGPYGELAVMDLSSEKIQELTHDGALALSPVWSADGQSIYFASSRGGTINLWKIPARGGSPVQITAGRGDDVELDLSVDGQRIVFSTYRSNVNLEEISVDSASGGPGRRWLMTDSARGGTAPAYSPDGRHIAYFTNRKGAENEGIWVMDADGSNPVKLVDDERINAFPRWTRDGQALIFFSRLRAVGADRGLRRLLLSGTVPEKVPVSPGEPWWGDTGPDGRLVFRAQDGRTQLFDPRTSKTQLPDGVQGHLFRWSFDGRHISFMVSARQAEDREAGLWIYDFVGTPRQLFRGWVVWYAWAGPNEIFVLEGKSDLTAVLWRVQLDGSPPVHLPASLRVIHSYARVTPYITFDIHPDRRRIAVEASRFKEADIGMIENIR